MLKKCHEYLYKIHFVLELDANILIAQLNWSVNDLLKVLVMSWIAWIQFFDFTVKHVSENKHTAADELFCWLKIKDENEKEKNINNFINFQLNIIRILNLKLNELKNKLLESEYFFEHQQITYYLMLLQKLIDIS